jgi:hypothetical protein
LGVAAGAAGGGGAAGGAGAQAACSADLTNAPYGASDLCTDYAYGYDVFGVAGRARYEIFCGSTLIATGILSPGGFAQGNTNGSFGCSVTLRLTSLQSNTFAYGAMD